MIIFRCGTCTGTKSPLYVHNHDKQDSTQQNGTRLIPLETIPAVWSDAQSAIELDVSVGERSTSVPRSGHIIKKKKERKAKELKSSMELAISLASQIKMERLRAAILDFAAVRRLLPSRRSMRLLESSITFSEFIRKETRRCAFFVIIVVVLKKLGQYSLFHAFVMEPVRDI